METPYLPISCSVHDQLLALATTREECELVIRSGSDGEQRIRGVIADVYTRAGAEYLQVREGPTVRLDRILSLNGRPVPAA
jgi:Rho-binding antiterminator